VPSCTDGGSACGDVPFPSLLWEFKDTADEDAVGGADEAESWSRPVIARIKVCDHECDAASEPEDRWVAIVGGGLPENPVNSSADTQGNWLYILDAETGRILYKRGGAGVISGAVAADITVVDDNFNGLVDTLYFGTTAGLVYKMDLGEGPFELGDDGRIQDPTGQPGRYNPFVVFTTLDTSTLGIRPIYLEISAVFVPQLRANALVFGTGNRWNLWDFGGTTGRFYAIVDTGWHDNDHNGVIDPVGCGTCTEPLTEASFEAIDPDSAFTLDNPGPSYLFGNPDTSKLPGWYFTLGNNEKLITEPFALSGITFFTIYDPISTEAEQVCALGGESKIFTVNTANAAGYTVAAGTTTYTRYVTASKFTTQPFTEQSATGNQGTGTGTNADQWTDELRLINKELKKLFPADCRFANYTLDIKTIRSDTGIVFIAPVPICIESHNWKEY
jgi:Tfp pilus tip-associated adhesin PilY1